MKGGREEGREGGREGGIDVFGALRLKTFGTSGKKGSVSVIYIGGGGRESTVEEGRTRYRQSTTFRALTHAGRRQGASTTPRCSA